jgi:alpha-beta hydrolase superfamily lysophospholipase
MLLMVVVLVAVVGVAYLVYTSRAQALAWIHPARYLPDTTPRGVYEDVELTTSDGLRLAAWFIPGIPTGEKAPTMILVHGLTAHRAAMLDRAEILNRHGYAVLAFDLRNHGESDGDITTLGYLEVNEVRAAFDYLLTRTDVEPQRIGILGHSLGAVIAIRTAAQIPEIALVVSESGFISLQENTGEIIPALTGQAAAPLVGWFVDRESGVPISEVNTLLDAPKIAPRPMLFVHGESDNVVNVSNSRRLFEAAGEPKELFTIPNGGHADFIQADPAGYEARLIAFLEAHL